MWPWGHAAVGYLLYAAVSVGRGDGLPRGLPVAALLVGTQFPDLVDKPLAWTVHFLPAGRSLAHSLLTTAAVVAALAVALRRLQRTELAVAFGVGYVSHVAGDAVRPLVAGEFADLTFLVWPLLPAPTYQTEPSFLAHVLAFRLDAFALLELVLATLAFVVAYAAARPRTEAPSTD